MKQAGKVSAALANLPTVGLAGWLLERLRIRERPQPRLALLERIPLAPRQSLALIEAEGRRFLVATSAEGGPAFYALDDEPRPAAGERATSPVRLLQNPSANRPGRAGPNPAARVSW
jgi:flagellar biogenesis protein FliO